MRSVPALLIGLALLAGCSEGDVVGSSGTPVASSAPAAPVPPGCQRQPRGGDNAYPVEGAGTVEVRQDSGRLVLVETRPAAGWSSAVEQDDGTTVRVIFRKGAADSRVFSSMLVDGSIVVDVCRE